MTDCAHEPSLASRLRLAVVRLNRKLRAQRAGDEVSLTHMAALSTLHRHGAMSIGQLAAREMVQPPSMTRVVVRLEERGYLLREAHPTDGRQAIVSLSDKGRDHVHATISAREAWLDKRLNELDSGEREVLARAAEIIDTMTES